MSAIECFTGASSPGAKRVISLGLILLGGTLGCGAADVTDDAAGAEPVALFRDPSTSGPRLDVYDFDGHAAISVSGPIGSEGVASGLSGGESLVEIYRALHPTEATIPPSLIALDERIAPELAALRSAVRPPVTTEPATLEKSQSDFNSTLCQNFSEGDRKYTARECRWSNMGTGVGVGFSLPPKIEAGDRTYGWNHSANPSNVRWLYDENGFWKYHSSKLTLPAYWWAWISIGSGGPYYATIVGTGAGERGLTWHSLSYKVF